MIEVSTLKPLNEPLIKVPHPFQLTTKIKLSERTEFWPFAGSENLGVQIINDFSLSYCQSFDAVNTLVSEEVRAPTKGLLTLLALERLFPGVNSLVKEELGVLAECFPTLTTFIRLLSNVNLLVEQQLRAIPEGSRTLITLM